MKACQVYFHTQQTAHHFDFRARSNDQIIEDCSEGERMHEGIEDHLVNASPVGLPASNVETSVHNYLGGLFLL